jgi:hypothetical protein
MPGLADAGLQRSRFLSLTQRSFEKHGMILVRLRNGVSWGRGVLGHRDIWTSGHPIIGMAVEVMHEAANAAGRLKDLRASRPPCHAVLP